MMENKKDIVSKLEEVIIREKGKAINSKLANANEYYNKLLKRGLIKKRGYTLRGIEDTHLLGARLNSHR